ncbi:porin, partial [Methylobacterium iners]|uniref:porin n=2 Tax=Methylobacterium iners TaxID=418707 RepID=UPI003613D2A6
MRLLKSSLLGSVAGVVAVAGAQAADLPVKKAVPVEYVRVCSAYGAGFFYIPGTDTCLRVSGRARFEVGYAPTDSRTGTGNGDLVGYRGLARINLDARTQTGYGTLRAFTRLEFASRTGATQGIRSGTQERIGNAFGAIGQDQNGRV